MSLEKLAPNVYAFPEVAAPGTPPTGYVYLYFKSDGLAYIKDDTGTETSLGSAGGAAPSNATYIVQTANGTLSAEQALAALATGYMKVTTTTGVVSSQAVPFPIADGGTNATTKTNAFDNLAPTATKGDLIGHNGSDNTAIPIGANGMVLHVNTSAAESLDYVGSLIEIVAAVELGSSQTTITLSSIPATYQDLLLVMRLRSTSTVASVLVTFNADTGSSYARNGSTFDNAANEAHTAVHNQTSIAITAAVPASTATAKYFGALEMSIRAYANADITRTGHYFTEYFNSATDLRRNEGAYAWENVANAMTSIELNLSVGNFEAGTTYALYGIGIAS